MLIGSSGVRGWRGALHWVECERGLWSLLEGFVD